MMMVTERPLVPGNSRRASSLETPRVAAASASSSVPPLSRRLTAAALLPGRIAFHIFPAAVRVTLNIYVNQPRLSFICSGDSL